MLRSERVSSRHIPRPGIGLRTDECTADDPPRGVELDGFEHHDHVLPRLGVRCDVSTPRLRAPRLQGLRLRPTPGSAHLRLSSGPSVLPSLRELPIETESELEITIAADSVRTEPSPRCRMVFHLGRDIVGTVYGSTHSRSVD